MKLSSFIKRMVATVVAKATHPEGALRRWSLYTLLAKERAGTIHTYRDEEFFLWIAINHTDREACQNAVTHLKRRAHLERVLRESMYGEVRVAALNKLSNEAEPLFSELMMHDADVRVREAAKKRIEQSRATRSGSKVGGMLC